MPDNYEILDKKLAKLFSLLGINEEEAKGLHFAYDDKCDQYKQEWEEAGVPYEHGVMIYMLTFVSPFSENVRSTKNGWVAPEEWVIDTYFNKKFLEYIFLIQKIT